MKEIGSRLTQIRKKLGLTQKEFAELLNVSSATLQGYEYGKIAKGEVLCKLLELGFDLNWLFSGNGDMERDRLENKNQRELDRILIWNVAYFIGKRIDTYDNPEEFAQLFMDMLDQMHEYQVASENEEIEETANNVVDLQLHRLSII